MLMMDLLSYVSLCVCVCVCVGYIVYMLVVLVEIKTLGFWR